MSKQTADGQTVYNGWADYTLRASAATTGTALVNEDGVAGFGGMHELLVEVEVTAVSLTGGTAPTAKLQVWIQRKLPDDTVFDDLLAFETVPLGHGAAALQHVADWRAAAAPVAPRPIQAAGGVPPFVAAGAISLPDVLRVAAKLVMGGSVLPTAQSVTWSVKARARA